MIITPAQALEIIKDWKVCQVDTETTGRDAHLCRLLSVQLGNDKADIRIVIDCSTVDIKLFKDFLENTFCIFQNGKFDLQFFFNYGIVIRKLYDTMIVEQLLHLGWPSGVISYSLKALCERYLNIKIDKTVRGEIIWRGLDDKVILYAASDVTNLEKIMHLQVAECRKKGCLVGAKLECDAVAPIAYMEWCGIHLDADKWKAKMVKDKENLDKAKKALDDFIIRLSKEGYKKPYKDDLGNTFYNTIDASNFKKYVFIDRQGDLFTGFDLTPKVTINWSSSQQVVKIAKLLGFNTTVQDKKTGEDKDSVLEKQLKGQKGVCDEFLKLYFDYQGYNKVVTSFGQGHLNAINPITHRIHTTFKQLGASSGRMSCGSQQPNTDLAKANHVKPQDCTYVNLQQLPSDEETRASFTAESGNMFVSCDFSSEESRLAADIYNDTEFKKEFLERTGDTHSMFAWAVFKNECKQCGCKSALDVKKLAPQWRKKVKAVEFAYLFGAAAPTISKSADCTVEEAQKYIDTLNEEFKGVSTFASKGAAFVRSNGYILINPITGHKLYWWDWQQWKEESSNWNQDFWEKYRQYHKSTGDEISQQVRHHFQAAGKYDRLARNVVTQGTGAIILKTAIRKLFDWIVDNNYFGRIKLCVCVHDEINCEYPKEVVDFPKTLENIMEASAAIYCKALPIPASPEVSNHWVH
jgi:DNA polymerase I-like protein with 3'-5' exonuclease and polymerase domains